MKNDEKVRTSSVYELCRKKNKINAESGSANQKGGKLSTASNCQTTEDLIKMH